MARQGSPSAPPREQLAALLTGMTVRGSFSTRRTVPADDLHIEVRGVGPLRFPVPVAQARLLRALARPARYGQGEQTLLDSHVRDTGQTPLSRVKIDKRRWNRTLAPVLERLASDLGLPAGSRLRAQLQSMLVYGPGQFFVPHQDSEKTDGMVASLVVTLPGSFTGGALLVTHGGVTKEYRASKDALSFVAFYADCRHEVRPVRTGNRIVLTYNLLLDRGAATAQPSDAMVAALADRIRAHFRTGQPSDRLVYLLDHEYTERGLAWAWLKGVDAGRAAALRAAAERAGCESVLALANVQETWDCADDGWDRRGSQWYDDERDDDEWDDEADPEGYELGDLLDWSITLTRLTDTSGVEPIMSAVSDAEVCASTPSVQLEPYESEYEGYMGNYGNTMDRWYHRGAVVLWPREHAFAVHAEASARWALATLAEPIRAGDEATARDLAASLEPFWAATLARADQPALITAALEIGAALDEPNLAALLLRPFRAETITSGQAPELVALVARYGEPWADEMLTAQLRGTWPAWSPHSIERPGWVASLPQLCRALHATDPATGTVVARLLLRHAWTWLHAEIRQPTGTARPSAREQRLTELAMPILGILAGTAAVGATDLTDVAVAALCADPDDALLGCLMQVLRAADGLTNPGLDSLADHCANRLRARLARPARAAEDWSIPPPPGCRCDLCAKLEAFLGDPEQRHLEWPLAEAGRKHVHGIIDQAELPIGHQTRRSGRPYTLLLTKTAAIFERETHTRQRDEADLAWLDSCQRW